MPTPTLYTPQVEMKKQQNGLTNVPKLMAMKSLMRSIGLLNSHIHS
jgi:hypothetical protein